MKNANHWIFFTISLTVGFFLLLVSSVEGSPIKRKKLIFIMQDGQKLVALGTALAGDPPHRSQHARLTHWALALGPNAQAPFRIGVKVCEKDRFEYKYSLVGANGRVYAIDVDSRLHEVIVKTEGDPVGRFVEYDMDKEIFRFLD